MILKAGTYRFNDELTAFTRSDSFPLEFSCTANFLTQDYQVYINQTRTYNTICFDVGNGMNMSYDNFIDGKWQNENLIAIYVYKSVDYNGWTNNLVNQDNLDFLLSNGLINQTTYDYGMSLLNSGYQFFGEGIKTITLATDQEVADDFGTWYIANTNYNEVNGKVIKAGTYRFNEKLTLPDGYDGYLAGKFYPAINLVCSQLIDLTGNELGLPDGMHDITFNVHHIAVFVNSNETVGMEYFLSQIAMDGVVTDDDTLPSKIYAYDDFADAGWGEDGTLKDIDILEDATVSEEFYNWFVANASATKVIKAGQYKFKDKIDLSTAPFATNASEYFGTCLIGINFRLPTITKVISQSEADEINALLAQGGITDTLSAGTYTANRSYNEIYLLENPNNDETHYAMWYQGGNTEVSPDTNVIPMLLGDMDEVYNTYYDEPWCVDLGVVKYQTIILDTDQTVTEEFYTWFMNNVEPTFATIKAKIQSLIDKSNATTGNNDTDLFAAVDNLIGGYGASSPEYDGTVIIEKAESVLGLRKFKETIDTNLYGSWLFNLSTNNEEFFGIMSEDMGKIWFVDENYEAVLMYDDESGWEDGFDRIINIKTYPTVPDELIDMGITVETLIEWLLANTEGVSV